MLLLALLGGDLAQLPELVTVLGDATFQFPGLTPGELLRLWLLLVGEAIHGAVSL